MIICPLTNDECTKLIPPRAKGVFVMSPKKMSKNAEVVKNAIIRELKKYKYKVIIGANIVDIGDYFCGICKNIIGSAFGIAFYYHDMPPNTLCNIFMEKGLMHGFGKPVILFVDKYDNLPSDFARDFVISFEEKQYLKKFRKLLKIINQLAKYYFEDVGDIALDAGDFEKASRYFKEGYLIGGVDRKNKIKNLTKTLNGNDIKSEGMKKRILADLKLFKFK